MNRKIILLIIMSVLILPICLGGEYQPDVNTFLLLHFNEGDTKTFNELHKANLETEWVQEGFYGYAIAKPSGSIPLLRELDLTGESFTIEFWYMPLNSNDGSRWLGSCDGDRSGFVTWGCEEDIYLWGSKMYAVQRNSGSKDATTGGWGQHIGGDKELEKGKWYHIAYEFVSGAEPNKIDILPTKGCTTLYINGVADAQRCMEGSIFPLQKTMGSITLASGGVIDELRISNTKFYPYHIDPNTNIRHEKLTLIEPEPEPPEVEVQFVSSDDKTSSEIKEEVSATEEKEEVAYGDDQTSETKDEVKEDTIETASKDDEGFSWGSFIFGIMLILFILYLISYIRKKPNRKITHCSHCKTEFDQDDLFCPKCGKKRKRTKNKVKTSSDFSRLFVYLTLMAFIVWPIVFSILLIIVLFLSLPIYFFTDIHLFAEGTFLGENGPTLTVLTWKYWSITFVLIFIISWIGLSKKKQKF